MTQKVQVIVFSRHDSGYEVLLFKRAGVGSWQPITGGVEVGESIDQAALREAGEEAGIAAPIRIISNIYNFTFQNPPEHRRAGPVEEYVLAYEVGRDFVPVISEEHSEFRWFTFDEARERVPTDDQRIALDKLRTSLEGI